MKRFHLFLVAEGSLWLLASLRVVLHGLIFLWPLFCLFCKAQEAMPDFFARFFRWGGFAGYSVFFLALSCHSGFLGISFAVCDVPPMWCPTSRILFWIYDKCLPHLSNLWSFPFLNPKSPWTGAEIFQSFMSEPTKEIARLNKCFC